MTRPGPKPISPDAIRKCTDCDYTGRVDSFPVSKVTPTGLITYRTQCAACRAKRAAQAKRKRKPGMRKYKSKAQTLNHGRRIDAVSMVKFLLQPIPDTPMPQEKMKVADIILSHYTEMTRGEANRMITRVLRANGNETR